MNSSAALSVLARDDDMPNSHDGKAAKRQHRLVSDNETPWKQTPIHNSPPKPSMDPRSSFANRRRSGLRDYKPPLGPRPPDFANSKRVSSENINPLQLPTSRRSFLPNTTSEPFLGLSARRKPSESEFMNNPKLDQAQAAIAKEMHVPQRPSASLLNQTTTSENNGKVASPDTMQEASFGSTPGNGPPSVINPEIRNDSTLRASPGKQRNPALRAAQLSTASASGPAVVTPLTIRTKRQSQIPSSAAPVVPEARQPRKSVGPGLPVQGSKDEPALRFPVPVTANGRSPDFTWNFTNVKPKPRASMMPSMTPSLQNDSSTESRRDVKARSFHPSFRPPQGPILPGLPGDLSSDEHEKITDSTLSNWNAAKRSNASSSASKRQTLGLARAVSPTDARKLARASIMQPPPPMPARSPTPEFSSAPQSRRRTPTPPRQKQGTPSSFRATPEVGQGGLSTGRSASSRSSFNSNGPLNASSQQQTGFATPKSPNAKTKFADGNATGEGQEFVPPVPAIPKAFGSPNQNVDEPFFESFDAPSPLIRAVDTKNSRITGQVQSLGTRPDVALQELQQSSKHDYSSFPMAKEPRSRRRFTLGTKTEQSKSSTIQHSNRQTLQQMRLPPLNVLPLSQPTSEKIALLGNNQSQTRQTGASTPPSQRQAAKTPSTPLTASKATFPTFEFQNMHDVTPVPPLRASNATRDIPAESNAREESSGSSPTTFLTTSPANTPPAFSPIPSVPTIPSRASDSAHGSQEDVHKIRETYGDNRTSRLISLRGRISRTGKDSNIAQLGSASQADAMPAGRRKLSLTGWRRSSSKASHTNSNDEIPDASGEKIPDMPPPRLPPSSAWRESLSLNTSSGSSHAKQTDSNEPAMSPKTNSMPKEPKISDSAKSQELKGLHQGSSDQPTTVSERASAFLSPMHKILNSRQPSSPSSAANKEPEMNRDDLLADEEMRRLAAKKKEFEAAAKEVDQLRRKACPKERISPRQAAQTANLNIFERGEIIDYPDIYFCGLKDARKCIGDLAAQSSNFGYDDDRGDYNIVMGDHISYRYEVVDILGKGSFGQVVRCIDHRTGRLVAVKIIRNKKRFHQQALVEVNILQRLRDWDPQSKFSNVEFTQSFYFRGHLCISTELLGMNLYEFIKAHDFRGFSLKLIRRFTRQMLSSLSLLQNNKVIHCDLKPENILLAHPLQSEIKVIDFGSSCFENEKVYTYIQSRFYRSPEVILGMDYGMPIDMWSIGCILAELFTGYPIFPGENEQEQLACIMEVFGPPEKHLIERSSRKKLFFDSLGKPRVTVSSKGKRRRPSTKTLQQAIKCDDEPFLDFLAQCLRWDPERRLKPDRALSHDFVTGVKSRTRTAIGSGASSPAKRLMSSSQTPAKLTRPLPEPPAMIHKNGVAINSRGPSNSPIKSAIPPRRHSTILSVQPNAGARRGPNGAGVAPGLPRSTSGKPDMASAAAIASLRQR